MIVHRRSLLRADAVALGLPGRAALIALFILIYVAYAALGRDVFFNRANCAVCFSRDARADLSSYDPIGFYLPYIRVLVCCLTILIVWYRYGAGWIRERLPWAFAPFVTLALASCAWADAPWEALREAATLFALAVALPLLLHRLGLATAAAVTLHLIAVVLIISSVLAIAAPAIGQHTGDEVVQAAHAGRWRGLFGHKNGLGAWAAYGSVLLFTHSGLAGGWRTYWWLARACALACLIFAGSSTALILAATLAGAWLFLLSARRLGAGISLVLFLTLTCAAAAAGLFMLDDILELIGRDATFSGRTLIWDIMLDHFQQSGLLGQLFGAGYQSAGGAELASILENRFDQPMTPENSYLSLLMGLGFAGVATFFAPCLASLRKAFAWLGHAPARDRAAIEFALMTLFAALVASFTEATALVATAYDGILGFGALFALMALPHAPSLARVHGGRRPSAPTTAKSRRPSALTSSMPP